MPPKKPTSAAPKKAAGPAAHASYKDMIKEAILNLKERSGSSRQAIKKYVLANNKVNVSPPQFDSLFNRALKAGVENKDFTQPKGPSGPVKLAKKEAKPAAKPAAKKAAPKAGAKKAAPKKTAVKKAAPKKAAAAKPKAAADAKPKVLAKTKTGRVSKPAAKPAAKKAAPKKPAAKKAAPKKAAAPKKTASATPA